MCEPVSITAAISATVAFVQANMAAIAIGTLAVSAVASAGSGTAQAVNQQKAAKSQNKLSQMNQELQNAQVGRAQTQQAEAQANRAFELSRQFQMSKGQAQNAGLGDRSVRAIGRSLGFQLGADKATLKRNQEIANTQAAARMRGIQLTRESEKIQIGDTSAAGLGLQIGTSVIGAASSAVSSAGSLGFGKGGTADSGPLPGDDDFVGPVQS